ncbi:tryptophan--tRNA ligase [Candidatus Woesearchaeota archaeon]|nr:MAG: tryptophan--tRNA ligase [Candidatus Woesearchaeota archaeon]
MTEKMVVTPWEVKGEIDYNRLIEKFGLQKMPKLPKDFDHYLFRRNIVFAQRDFNLILDAIKKGRPFGMMTGLMPSGKFHFGHKLVADQIIFYQKLGARVYIAVADIEAYCTRKPDLESLRNLAIEEYLVNYVALGLKPENCDFYFQSERSSKGKRASAYYSLANMFSMNATFSEFKAVYGKITPSKMSCSLLQASDMFHPQLPEFEGKIPVVVPVGVDQDPHIRLARDIARRSKFDFLKVASTYHTFMPGLKGGKMSSSDPNSYIALSDSPELAEKKIKKFAFSGGRATLEEHRKKGGIPEVDVAFQLLRYGLEPDDSNLKKIYDEYKSGRLLTSELKKIAIEKVKEFLKKHQLARERARKKVGKFLR